MKVLLDENLTPQLRELLSGYTVATVRYMGWNGLKNGDLLRAAEQKDFEILLTGDQNLAYQQNSMTRRIALIVVTRHEWRELLQHVADIRAAVDRATPGSFQVVRCGV